MAVTSRLPRSVVALILVAALPCGVSRPLAAGEEPGQGDWAQVVGTTSRLVSRTEEQLPDAPSLAREVLALSPRQRRQVGELDAERSKEAERLLRELNRRYVARVEEVLTERQRKQYREVLRILRRLRQEAAAAREEFASAADIPADSPALGRLQVGRANPLDFLELQEETRRELTRLRRQLHDQLYAALQEEMGREQWSDLEAWRERREQLRKARREAREQFAAERAKLLSEQQRERLKRVEKALEGYRERLTRARGAATMDLLELMGAGGPD